MSTALEVALASILVLTSFAGVMSSFGRAAARQPASSHANDPSAIWERDAELLTHADRDQNAPALAQQAQSRAGGYQIKLEVNSVLLNVSVRDRRTNRTMPNLGKDDFLVYEDGVLQRVEQVIAGDAPFYPLLLLDNSGSTRKFLPLIKEAAIDFVDQLKPNDQVAVATFNSLIKLERDFTDDRAALAKAVDRIDAHRRDCIL